MSRRKLWIPFVVGAGSFLGTVVYRRRSVRNRNRLDVYFDDGSMVSLASGSPDADKLLPLAGSMLAEARTARMTRDELATRLLERAYLEGDFLLRSGRRSRYYLDKYRFETDPEILAGLGRELAALVGEHAPDAELLAGPELGAVPLAAVTSIEAGLPYLLVRKAAKEYGTAKRLEGVFEPGQRVCVVEDVVTSGGALLSAVEALREANLDVSAAICVVDREEGGAEAIAEAGVAFLALFTSSQLGIANSSKSA